MIGDRQATDSDEKRRGIETFGKLSSFFHQASVLRQEARAAGQPWLQESCIITYCPNDVKVAGPLAP